jgi:ribulose-bisphosphate carboxylase large chain
VRVENIEIDPSLLGLPGPRFGIEGMRELLGVESRPLLATALKPMGLGAEALASLAYRVARGGIDIIKDDHGLTNQHTAPFRERVSRCAEAVQKANRETQKNSLYLANVSADCDDLFERAEFARQAGAGGLLVAPGLVGFSGFAKLASRDDIALPMMSHPAFSGGWLASERAGIDHRVLLGTLQRLVGADMVVFPHASGRFPFSLEDCKRAAHGLAEPQRGLRPALAVPAGGMTLDRVPELWDIYGSNVVLLIGGDLFRRGPDMEDNARQFLRVVERRSPTN